MCVWDWVCVFNFSPTSPTIDEISSPSIPSFAELQQVCFLFIIFIFIKEGNFSFDNDLAISMKKTMGHLHHQLIFTASKLLSIVANVLMIMSPMITTKWDVKQNVNKL